jgi:hypothetical protein
MNARTPTPDLARHLRAITEGSQRDREWMADERFDEIVFLCDIAISHLISAREAGWRRDRALFGTHIGHGREGLILTLKAFKALPSESSEGPA